MPVVPSAPASALYLGLALAVCFALAGACRTRAFGNGGLVTEPRYILKVVAPDGTVIYEAGKPITKQVWKPSTALVMAGILDGNTNRAINPAWGAVFEMHNTRDGSRRPAAIKTGTTNELKDYSTYGILPMPRNRKQPALAVGVWFVSTSSRWDN